MGVGTTRARRGVALRKESVDRNTKGDKDQVVKCVALRKESVDRNTDAVDLTCKMSGSLSARRAWIEILIDDYVRTVANGRSPQGERG